MASDEAQIIELLSRVFSVGRDAPFLEPNLLRWKYWVPRSDCQEHRSFVMEQGGRIVAHVGLWPVTVKAEIGSLRGVQMIDWASDPQTPGAGVSLLNRLTKSYDFVYSIGGSEITQTILPKFGFRIVAQARTLVRPLRPWRQILRHQTRDPRLPLRLVRNFWWSKVPHRKLPQGWAAAETTSDDVGYVAFTRERDGNFFRYLRQCPSATYLGFDILNQNRKVGYFALFVVGLQARIAGVCLQNPHLEYWRTAFYLAQDAALRHTATAELVARTSAGDGAVAAEQAGMRLCRQTPVFLFQKAKGVEPLRLHFQLWDDDSFFLGGRQTHFLA